MERAEIHISARSIGLYESAAGNRAIPPQKNRGYCFEPFASRFV